ncbi:hypothetical protein F441_23033, partial [Phytophthora nicotianae CJ01A1]
MKEVVQAKNAAQAVETFTRGRPSSGSQVPKSFNSIIEGAVNLAKNGPNLKDVLEMLEKYPVQLEDPYLRARSMECHWKV